MLQAKQWPPMATRSSSPGPPTRKIIALPAQHARGEEREWRNASSCAPGGGSPRSPGGVSDDEVTPKADICTHYAGGPPPESCFVLFHTHSSASTPTHDYARNSGFAPSLAPCPFCAAPFPLPLAPSLSSPTSPSSAPRAALSATPWATPACADKTGVSLSTDL